MAYREFKDESGRNWRVWDVAQPLSMRTSTAGMNPDFAKGWITFECDTEKRRLSHYPKGWATMSDAELERLCGIAKQARRDSGEETTNP